MITQDKIEKLPNSPGVYLMKNTQGEILYVGKAKKLRTRVKSYFTLERDGRYQIQVLMRKVSEIEPIVTANEKEALLLENTLIKKHRPRYNILLRDDKSYLSLKLTVNHPYPRLIATRRIEKDGSIYYGPYPSGYKAREVLDFIDEHFHLRSCTERDFSNRVRPCLQYQIKRCDAPCVGYISQEAYREIVSQVRLFLQGKNRELMEWALEKMERASVNLQFEEAARWRDLLKAIEVTLERQKVVNHQMADHDTVGFYREGERVSLVILITRQGILQETKSFILHSPLESSELLESFLLQYYLPPSIIPKEILIPFAVEAKHGLEEIFSERKAQRVSLRIPKKGEKLERIAVAIQNATERLKYQGETEEKRRALLGRLQEKLHLNRLPRRIECYDISNLQGKMAVGSCVSFFDGEPDKKNYRHFKIKTVFQANDTAMLYEVLHRRFSRSQWPQPDLIVIDGGKGQLHAAEAALKDKNIIHVDLIALAKEKVIGEKGKHDLSKKPSKHPERVFLLGRKNPVIFLPHASELHLLMRARDEAHRFGITFHRKLRRREGLHSILDTIPGVGEAQKKKLLKHFGSLKRLSKVSLEEILAVPGVKHPLAERLYLVFHPREI